LSWNAASRSLLTAALAATSFHAGLAEAPRALQPALLEISINSQATGQPAIALRGPNGEIYLPAALLSEWHLRLNGLTPIDFDGTSYVLLSNLPGVTLSLNEESQSLALIVEPARLEPTVISYRPPDPGPMTETGFGGFLNYQLLAEASGGGARISGTLEAGIFSPHGFGTSSFLGRASTEGTRFTRLDTSWTIDDAERMRSLRLGDSISRGGVGGGPLRFGGVQFARNFAVQPGYVTIPMPSFGGSAALPSVVDIYVNDILLGRREIRPGPFQLHDVPVVTGNGEVQLVVRDLLGRETVTREAYYAAPILLRQGLHDYSYEAGFLRRGFGRQSNAYGALFVSGTHRLGLSDHVTGEAHFEATRQVQAAGVSASILIPSVGLLSAGAAASRSPLGEGGLLSLSFERRSRSLSIGAAAEFTSDEFTTIGSLPGRARPAATVQAFAGVPLPFGSLGASYIWRDLREGPDVEFVSANASIRLGRSATVNIAGRYALGPLPETAVEIFLTVPLGPSTYANAGLAYRNGDPSISGTIQRNLPAGEGIGYRLRADAGLFNRVEGRLDVQTQFGAYDMSVTWTDGATGVRFVAEGAIGVVGGRVFASRRLTQSFAVVRVGDFENVRVYADNQLVGQTNRNGVAIIPRLRPYERNLLRIEIADLPMDTRLTDQQRSVRPANRSGVVVDFGASRSRDALINVRLENGEPLPAGATLHLEPGGEDFVSAPGGDVYLSGLQASNVVIARYAGGTCQFPLALEGTEDPQPRLGGFACVGTRS
jgi:outer membrane usher protein